MKAQDILNTALDIAKQSEDSPKSKSLAQTMRYNGIYCFAKLESGDYIPVNRYYKPYGVTTSEWVNYEEYAHTAFSKERIELWADKCTTDIDFNGHWFFLWNDGCPPYRGVKYTRRYIKLLEALK